jgi:hypothetical protein
MEPLFKALKFKLIYQCFYVWIKHTKKQQQMKELSKKMVSKRRSKLYSKVLKLLLLH